MPGPAATSRGHGPVRPRRFRLWWLVANPLTTAVLLGGLWADLRSLALDYRASSVCGEAYRRLLSVPPFFPSQPPGPDTWIARVDGSLRIGGSVEGKAEASGDGEPFPDGATYEGGLRFLALKSRSGFWAPTRNQTEYCVDVLDRNRLTNDELARLRAIYVDRFVAPSWQSDPTVLPRLRTADVTVATPRWQGYLHNALAAATLFLALASLSWMPATFRWYRRRVRQRRGLCPACGYPLTGRALCPECGRPSPGP